MEDIYELSGLMQMYQATGAAGYGIVFWNESTGPVRRRAKTFSPGGKPEHICLL